MSNLADITVPCTSCGGIGSRITGYDEENNPIYEDPCSGCGGDGRSTTATIDISLIIEKANDILGKCNDILDKCNDILEQVQE